MQGQNEENPELDSGLLRAGPQPRPCFLRRIDETARKTEICRGKNWVRVALCQQKNGNHSKKRQCCGVGKWLNKKEQGMYWTIYCNAKVDYPVEN